MRHPNVSGITEWRRSTFVDKIMEARPDARNQEIVRQLKANKSVTIDTTEQGVDIFLGNKYLFSVRDETWLKTQLEESNTRVIDPLIAGCNIAVTKRVYFT